MKISNLVRITILTVIALSLGACSACGTSEELSEANAITVPKEDSNGNPYNSEGNRKLVPYNGIENIDRNTTLDNSKVTVIDTNKVETTIRSKKMPENSEITTEMNRKGHVIETRKFFDNPYLDKVVKTTITPKNVNLKVHLKNGRVKEIPPESIKDFRIAAVRTFLDAAEFEIPVDPDLPQKDGNRKPVLVPTPRR